MKPNLEKLYDKTPAEALATIATGALLRADSDELRRIFGGIEGRSSNSQARFSTQQHALTISALLWALDCQTTYGKALEMSYCIAVGELEPKEVVSAEILRRAMQARLASLTTAMRKICSKSGLDYEYVARTAGINDMTLRDDVPAIPGAVEEFVIQYRVE
jgi:hypothetical protein